MDEKIKQQLAKAKDFFSNMSKKTKRLLVTVLLLALAVTAVVLLVRASRPYSVLVTGMTSDDMSAVLSYLDANGVTDYKVQNNDTILVPEKQEASLKAKLLTDGYPASGFGYSMYLDHVGSLSTESDRRTLYLYDLQDRLGAVVRCLDGVKDARVTIAQGEDHRFILSADDELEASASVIVTMQGGREMTDQLAAAVRKLIGTAVQGLKIDNITITDSTGREYSGGGDSAETSDASQLKLALEERVNNNVRANILEVLIPLFGAENLSVSVNSTVDVSRTYKDSVTYDEPAWAEDGSTGGEGIIGSKVYDDTILRSEDGTVGGVAGAQSNAELPEYAEQYQPDGTERQITTSGEVQYNVDTHHVQSENPAGIITDVMVSVSINSSAVGSVNTNALLPHVARAAGIGAGMEREKISILPMPFHTAAPANPIQEATGLPAWTIYALAAGLALFLVLLAAILLLRRRMRRRAAASQQPEFVPAAPAPAPKPRGADIMDLHSERSMELRRDVREFAEENPEIAAQMVKSWLRGGDDRG